MPLDPARIAESRAWLHKASEDPRAGLHPLSAEPPFCADAAFHAQQAGEKAAKAFLTWHDRPFGKTHNLVELGRACTAIAPDLEPVLSWAAPLTEYAWRFRYPGDPEEPAVDEVRLALLIAQEALEAILAKLRATFIHELLAPFRDAEAAPVSDLSQRLQDALTDRYRIERTLGHGGMATVFLAEDLKHHRRVAIKVLDPRSRPRSAPSGSCARSRPSPGSRIPTSCRSWTRAKRRGCSTT